MSSQCLGTTTRGVRCRLVTRGTPYCQYHSAQGQGGKQCPPTSKTPSSTKAPTSKTPRVKVAPKITPRRRIGGKIVLVPLSESPLLASPQYRQLTEEVEEYTPPEEEYTPPEEEYTPPEEEYTPPEEEYTPAVEETHQCCICLDEEIPSSDLLSCQHPVCVPCLQQITKAECPICRSEIKGSIVDPDIITRIRQKEEEDRLREENANYLVALAMAENPDLDPQELYDRYYHVR
jgi:hypothetical protein